MSRPSAHARACINAGTRKRARITNMCGSDHDSSTGRSLTCTRSGMFQSRFPTQPYPNFMLSSRFLHQSANFTPSGHPIRLVRMRRKFTQRLKSSMKVVLQALQVVVSLFPDCQLKAVELDFDAFQLTSSRPQNTKGGRQRQTQTGKAHKLWV